MAGQDSSGGDAADRPTLGGLGPGEAERGEKALWLAGRGYRATLFHLGALTRLNELGMLAQTGTVGAVAGGSIVAASLECCRAGGAEGICELACPAAATACTGRTGC